MAIQKIAPKMVNKIQSFWCTYFLNNHIEKWQKLNFLFHIHNIIIKFGARLFHFVLFGLFEILGLGRPLTPTPAHSGQWPPSIRMVRLI